MSKKKLSTVLSDEKVRTVLAAAAFSLLILLTALVSNGNFLGQTLGAAFVPGQEQEEAAAQEKVAATKQPLSDKEQASEEEQAVPLQKMVPLPPKEISTETLWLARCIYSETKRPKEQELVAWVVRNRVETNYRGNDSYREAVLDPYQFSAFNPGSRKRAHYSSLTPASQATGWQRALFIAYQVKQAPAAQRPFSKSTRHFFSERSMAGGRHPSWASRGSKVTPERYRIQEDRFRFYEDVM